MNTASAPDITPIIKSKRAPRPRKRTPSTPLLAVTEERAPSAPKQTRRLGVVDQVRLAFARGHRLATLIGFVFGGAPSSLAYYLVHEQIPTLALDGWRLWATIGVVCGGLLFSLRTVYQWGVLALGSKPKAFGFCLIVEGAMIVALHAAVSLSALTILVLINGIATGTTLARGARVIEAKEEQS
jgi:hypothetical protein